METDLAVILAKTWMTTFEQEITTENEMSFGENNLKNYPSVLEKAVNCEKYDIKCQKRKNGRCFLEMLWMWNFPNW